MKACCQAASRQRENKKKNEKAVLAESNAHEREIVESSVADLSHAGVSESQARRAS